LGGALALVLGLAACDGGESNDAALPAAVGEDAAPVAAAAPVIPAPDLGAPVADRVAAVVGAVEEADQTNQCARGIKFLQEQLDGFDGPAAERDVIRTGLNTALAAFEAADTQTCLDAFADPLAVLGYVITAGTPETVPCTRGIDGAILMLDEIGGGERMEVQAFLEIAVAALERGDYYTCLIALGEALYIVKEALDAGG